jgi:hypothetical protein
VLFGMLLMVGPSEVGVADALRVIDRAADASAFLHRGEPKLLHFSLEEKNGS